MCGWCWLVERRLTRLAHTLGTLSLIPLLLGFCLTAGDQDYPRTFRKPTVSSLPVQAFSPTTDDQ